MPFYSLTRNILKRKTHLLPLSKYIGIYGQLEIIGAVYHKCGLCYKVMMMDNNTIASHLKKKHTLKVDVYHAQFLRKASKKTEKKHENKKTGEDKSLGLASAEEIQCMNTAELLSFLDKIIKLV